MIRTSFNLPRHFRLDIALVRRRGATETPLLPTIGELLRIKKGSRLSRFFRHIFEHKSFKRFFGANLALLFLATNLLDTQPTLLTDGEQNILFKAETPLSTENFTQYPVKNTRVSQGYAPYHPGLDFDGQLGDTIYPIKDGVVEAVGYSTLGYGNAVYVSHSGGLSSLYAHLSKLLVKEGEEVTTNTILGEMGATGRASGDHLHLEVRKDNYSINPYLFLPR